MDSFGWLWIAIDGYGWLWIAIDGYGWLWVVTDSYGVRSKFLGGKGWWMGRG